ncbi:Hypothetical predicted protein, partial [Paramuricea clavata]
MAINAKKTKDMWISFTDAIPEPPRLRIGNGLIERVNAFKLFGVSFQNNLKWNAHVEEITRKANKRLYHLRECRKSQLPAEVGIITYQSKIRPILECSKDLVVESVDGNKNHQLSNVIECNAIPDSKEEIPSTEVTRAHPHLHEIVDKISEIRGDVDILLRIGRNAPPLQKVHESRNGPRNAPWAQRLDLGWVIIGNACLDGAHTPKPSCYKTNVLESGRPSILSPCPNRFHIKEYTSTVSAVPCDENNDQRKETFENGNFDDGLAAKVFASSKDDNKPGPSVKDTRFVNIMEHQTVKNEAGNWEAPLPFRNPISRLPDNREDT